MQQLSGKCRLTLIKAENFHSKGWFKEDKHAHGYNGPLDIEPHDPVGAAPETLTVIG